MVILKRFTVIHKEAGLSVSLSVCLSAHGKTNERTSLKHIYHGTCVTTENNMGWVTYSRVSFEGLTGTYDFLKMQMASLQTWLVHVDSIPLTSKAVTVPQKVYLCQLHQPLAHPIFTKSSGYTNVVTSTFAWL